MPKDSICGEFSLHCVATEGVCRVMSVCREAAVGAGGRTCPCARTDSVWGQSASRWPPRDIGCVALRNSLGQEIWALLFLFEFSCVSELGVQSCRTQTFPFLSQPSASSLSGAPNALSRRQKVNGTGFLPQKSFCACFRQLPIVPLVPRGEPEEVPTDRNVLLLFPVMKSHQCNKS